MLTDEQKKSIADDPYVVPFLREVLDEALAHEGAMSEEEFRVVKVMREYLKDVS